MKLLSIETSGRTFGVALYENGRVVREIFDNSGFVHSAKLIPQITKMLGSAGWLFSDLDKIAVTTGPGSFTGIRVGLTCAKVLAQALNIRIVGIDTLTLLRSSVPKGDYAVVSAIDAGRGEVYAKNKAVDIVKAEKYFAELKSLKKKVMITGNAALVYAGLISKVLKGRVIRTPEEFVFPRAGALAALAGNMRGDSFDKVKALYVRRSWAEEKRKK